MNKNSICFRAFILLLATMTLYYLEPQTLKRVKPPGIFNYLILNYTNNMPFK